MTEVVSAFDRTMYILRGLPGSGKTTHTKQKGDPLVASADLYFVRPDGTYDWNSRLLKNAHEWCYQQAKQFVSFGRPFFIDNTNIKRVHFARYLELAKQSNYNVREVVVGSFDENHCKIYAERNTHQVPLMTIIRMAKEFEQ